MDRQKAVALLREILEISKHTDIRAITLNQEKEGDFSLKLDCSLSNEVKEYIKPIISKDKLVMRQEKDSLVIYSIDL